MNVNWNAFSSIIRIGVNDILSNVLFDSGAAVSAVQYEYAVNTLGCRLIPLEQGDTKGLMSADKQHIPVEGKVILTLNFNGLLVNYWFLVVKNLSATVICGTDFYAENNVITDYKEGVVIIGDTIIPFYRRVDLIGHARVLNGLRLKPGGSKTVRLGLGIQRKDHEKVFIAARPYQ